MEKLTHSQAAHAHTCAHMPAHRGGSGITSSQRRTAVTLQRPLGPRKGGQGTALCSLNDHDIHLFTNHLHKKRTKLEQIIRELGDKETVMQPRGRAGGTGWLAPLGHLLGPQAGKGLHPPRHQL